LFYGRTPPTVVSQPLASAGNHRRSKETSTSSAALSRNPLSFKRSSVRFFEGTMSPLHPKSVSRGAVSVQSVELPLAWRDSIVFDIGQTHREESRRCSVSTTWTPNSPQVLSGMDAAIEGTVTSLKRFQTLQHFCAMRLRAAYDRNGPQCADEELSHHEDILGELYLAELELAVAVQRLEFMLRPSESLQAI
jgi:hypothetical protein